MILHFQRINQRFIDRHLLREPPWRDRNQPEPFYDPSKQQQWLDAADLVPGGESGTHRSRRKCNSSWCRRRLATVHPNYHRAFVCHNSHFADRRLGLLRRLVDLLLPSNLVQLQAKICGRLELWLFSAQLVGPLALRDFQLIALLDNLHRGGIFPKTSPRSQSRWTEWRRVLDTCSGDHRFDDRPVLCLWGNLLTRRSPVLGNWHKFTLSALTNECRISLAASSASFSLW